MSLLKSRLITHCFGLLLTVTSAFLIADEGDELTPAAAPAAANIPGAAPAVSAIPAAPASTNTVAPNQAASAAIPNIGVAPAAAAIPAVPAPIQPAAAAAVVAPAATTEPTDQNPEQQSLPTSSESPIVPAPTPTESNPVLPEAASVPEQNSQAEVTPQSESQAELNLQTVPQAAPQKESDATQAVSNFIPQDQASDVRVIIDISGSMKQNDPNNLRIPALNLIVEMLPEGSQAGVWTFGQWVNMLIPPAEVNQAWRDNAKEQAKKINSHGLRTNIGEAMEKATWKLAKDSGFAQSVILLTDGLVDIADEKDPQKQDKDEAERQRILTDVLNFYKDSGTKIHTIALSENADKQLLDRLSLETGGMAEVVRTSEELVKAFVKTFDQAAPEVAEQVPLSKDNTFNIDNSVQEFTALIFRKAGTPAAQLKDPSGNVISQIKAIPNARWFGESVYDLVTVEQPEPGEWQILADLDPDNRVTVVSDLKMEIENLPTNLFPGQQIDFEVYLHEQGEIISRKEFLQLMTVEMKMTTQSGRSGTKVISDPENVPEDGRYRESIKRLSKEGEYELQIRVDGKTFQRLRKTYLQVRQPVGFEIRKRRVEGKMGYAVRVIPQSPAVKVADTRVIAKLKGPDKHSIIQSMPWVEEGVWEAVVSGDKGPGPYQISMNIKGMLGENQEFRVKPEPIVLTFPVPADFTHEYFVKDESVEIEPPMEEAPADIQDESAMPDLADKMKDQAEMAEPEAEDPQQEPAEDEPAPEMEAMEGEASEGESEEAMEEESGGLPMWLLILIPAVTVFAGLGGFLGYRAVKKKKAAKSDLSDKAAPKEDDGMKMPDEVSLNDGLDDGDFDDDFDLSDADEDEEIALGGDDDDDLGGLDLGDDDDDDMIAEEAPLEESSAAPEPPSEPEDAIPDFDEDFDLGGDDEPPTDEVPDDVLDEPSAGDAVDDLEEVLDSALGEDDEPPAMEEDVPTLDSDPGEPPEAEESGDENIDEALANLENELDDIDIEGLMDDDESPEEDK